MRSEEIYPYEESEELVVSVVITVPPGYTVNVTTKIAA